jgi:hypothetical protein
MQGVPAPQDRSRCFVCHAVVAAGSLFCAVCGARQDETAAQELRSVIYLLSELSDWEAQGMISPDEAGMLRRRYESRRDELRAGLALTDELPGTSEPLTAKEDAAKVALETKAQAAGEGRVAARSASRREARRPLFETLADPHTLRLLLYTGAAMLVVGIVIWLRDVLYLKLQEPQVQAALLACGTVAAIVSGWMMTLRVRLRLTGRALTLTGSLLFPINFWFLVRSGLIENRGRAWMVCALCAALYAQAAALLRERLYVYMACAASVAAAWALIFRAAPEAYGLYALSLMTAALLFLHLSTLFPRSTRRDEGTFESRAAEETTRAGQALSNEASSGEASSGEAPSGEAANDKAASGKAVGSKAAEPSRWSYELWGRPLVRVALFAATAAAFSYMLLHAGASPARDEGMFRWRTSDYDASIAILLFSALAYVAWFAARYVYTARRPLLYTTSALALFWTVFLLLDGLRLSGRTRLLTLAATALVAATAARLLRDAVLAEALHRASAMVLTLLLLIASAIALLLHLDASALETGWRPAIFFVMAVTLLFGALRGGRVAARSIYGAGLATLAALVLVASLLDALAAAGVLPSSWPIAGGVVVAAFLLQWVALKRLRPTESAAVTMTNGQRANAPFAGGKTTSAPLITVGSLDAVIRMVTDSAALVCALLWLVRLLALEDANGWSAAFVMLAALLYWTTRAAHARQSWLVYLVSLHAGALLLALCVAVHIEWRWFAIVFALLLFPTLFAIGRRARGRVVGWLARPVSISAAAVVAGVCLALVLEAAPVLQTGNELLLAPCVGAGALLLATLGASLFSAGRERVGYFRTSLGAAVAAFILLALRAGYDPFTDVEMYTSPVAVLLLVVSYLILRREWDATAHDATLLLWTGSLLLCGPLLIRALQFRLLLYLPAPWRDLVVLCVALALILFGALGRLRAPVINGVVTLLLELIALALTSVRWLQVPLKVYLITAGGVSIVVWGVFEYRREQLLLVRQRLHERGAQARERFEEWR